jgi:hypothetical protein
MVWDSRRLTSTSEGVCDATLRRCVDRWAGFADSFVVQKVPAPVVAPVTKGRVTLVGGVSLKQIRAFWFTLLKLYAKSSPMRSRGASEAVSKANGCF